MPPEEPGPTPETGPAGFLPAPTLTNPDELRNNPPSIYRPASAPPEPTAMPTPTPVTLGGIIREGIVAASYLWLCTGLALLIGIGASAFWLARRAARRERPHGP